MTEQSDAAWLEIQKLRRIAEEEYFQHRDLGNPLYYLDVLRDEAVHEMRAALAARTTTHAGAPSGRAAIPPAAGAALEYLLERFAVRARAGARLTDHERSAIRTLRDWAGLPSAS